MRATYEGFSKYTFPPKESLRASRFAIRFFVRQAVIQRERALRKLPADFARASTVSKEAWTEDREQSILCSARKTMRYIKMRAFLGSGQGSRPFDPIACVLWKQLHAGVSPDSNYYGVDMSDTIA